MKKSILALLAFLPLLADAASYRTMKPEILFEEQIALTKRDEASGATVTALDTSTSFIKITGTVTTVQGAVPPPSPASRMIIVSNQSGSSVVFEHEALGATAANRFVLSEGEDLEVPAGGSAMFLYDHGQSRWVGAGGGGGGVNFTAIAPIDYDTVTKELTCDAASGSQPGCLSSADWTNFNDGAADAAQALLDAADAQQAADDAQADADTANTAIGNHIADTVDAHDASAISNTPSGNTAATDVQGAINELQTDVDTRIADPGSSQNGLSLQKDGGATAWRAQAQRKNWLVNESFEYATATASWTTSGATFAADTSTKVFGAQSIEMAFAGSGAGSISQSVTPPVDYQGKSIQHTAWVKTTDPGVDVCSLRAGTVFECKRAPADGIWHEIGFLYTDPGTGTRGISISRTDGSASDTYIDGVYVGPYEPNVPANITVGAQWKGSVSRAGSSGCAPTNATVAWTDFPTNGSCAAWVPADKSAIQAIGTTKIGFSVSDATPGKVYKIHINGLGKYGSSGTTQYRFSDGTDHSTTVSFFKNDTTEWGAASNIFYLRPTTAGSKTYYLQNFAMSASAGLGIIYNGTNDGPLTITVEEIPEASSLAGSIITDQPWYYLSSKMTTRVTSTPDAEGEYRSYQKTSSAFTGTDAAPATAPSAANGFKMTPIPYGSAGSSGEQRYEFFVGKDKTIIPEFYSTTGRTGPVDVTFREYGGATLVSGLGWSYDPSTGVLSVDSLQQSTSTTTRYFGWTIPTAGGAYTQQATGYFDVKVFNNPLAAGMKTAEDYLQLDGHDGVDTTNTRILRFTSVYQSKGDAFTYAVTAGAGSSITINKDGFYSISFSDRNPASVDSFAITKNATSVSADASNFTSAMGLLAAARSTSDWAVNLAWSGPLKKGDVIRVHTNGNSTSNAIVNSMFAIAKAPSPFEIAGSAERNGPKVEFVTFGGSTEPNACTGTPCTAWRKSNGISSVTRSATGTYSVNFVSGTFSQAPTCNFTPYSGNNYARNQVSTTMSTSAWALLVRDTNTQNDTDSAGYVTCVGF